MKRHRNGASQTHEWKRSLRTHTVNVVVPGAIEPGQMKFASETAERWATMTLEITGGQGTIGGRAFRRFLNSVVVAGVKFSVSNDCLSVTLRGPQSVLNSLLSHPSARGITTLRSGPRQGTGQGKESVRRRDTSAVVAKLPGGNCRNEAERERYLDQIDNLANRKRIAHTMSGTMGVTFQEAMNCVGL